MDETLLTTVLDRLDAADLDPEVGALVWSACVGQLDEALGGQAPPRPEAESRPRPQPLGAYLASVEVQGFRGIGEKRRLEIQPGPGLTLVVGRNGSGKSSFAEALEVLLTGANRRWDGRPAAWQHGWRNLHQTHPCSVRAEVMIEGEGPAVLRRVWADDAELAETQTVVRRPGREDEPLGALGWTAAIESFRPFLSYNELGSMLDARPSDAHDALAAVLGLDDLVDVEAALRGARQERDRLGKEVKDRLAPLLERLAESTDERAVTCLQALRGRARNLDTVEVLLLDEESEGRVAELASLRTLAGLDVVADPAAQVSALREALRDVEATSGTDAARARDVAATLEAALAAHERHGDQPCPVCGEGSLDSPWRDRAEAEAARLRGEAAAADTAHVGVRGAVARLRGLIADVPPTLTVDGVAMPDVAPVVAAWRRWAEAPEDPAALADHVEATHPPLMTAVGAVRRDAAVLLDERREEWRPLARDLQAWLGRAREAEPAVRQSTQLRTAEKWVQSTAAGMRTERLRPIVEETRRLWSMLRQQSSVALDEIVLAGATTRRRLELGVSVEGSAMGALGVMSQGELHALALCLFLPRATLAASPFRFLVIDDPVQSMDPARVDGLAQALDDVARDRQVVVFTHDDRLPEAVRRLDIDARVVGVTRRPGSRVELHDALDPVQRHLDDARALARSTSVPAELAARVVAGLCRAAVEAACVEAVRRRRLRRGDPHAEVEEALAALRGTNDYLALALDVDGSGVLGRLNSWGRDLADAYQWCRKDAHQGSEQSDLPRLVARSGDLAQRLQRQT